VRKRARARHVDVNFARDLVEASPPTEWRQEIDQTLFPGGYFKEFIFFHKTSKTLIVADTIINIELDKVAEPWRTATKFTSMFSSACGCRCSSSGRGRRRQSQKSTRGSRSVFCSAMIDVSMQMRTK
jgi:DNA-binding XRE family transcriptional regulator